MLKYDIKFCFQAAEFLDIPDLFSILSEAATSGQQKLVNFDQDLHIEDQFNKTLLGLEDLCLADGLFSDVLFKLEDGTCSAHKPILMARSDMMVCDGFVWISLWGSFTNYVDHLPPLIDGFYFTKFDILTHLFLLT